MKDLMKRIIVDPKIMTGKPVVKGTRLTVGHILGMLAEGITIDDLLLDYPNLDKNDVLACFIYAKNAVEDTTFMPININNE